MRKFVLLFALLLSIAAGAQDMIVIVTTSGDLQAYPINDGSGMTYNAESQTYTLQTSGQILNFAKDDIKQIYFEDKSVIDQDPFITPSENDKYNPNTLIPDKNKFEIIEHDDSLCRMKIRFADEVPSLYVGRILTLEENDSTFYNLYVLTYKVDGKVAEIRYRNAAITEMLYNTTLFIASNTDPDSMYFKPSGEESAKSRNYIAPQRGEFDVPEVTKIPSVKMAKNAIDFFKANSVELSANVNCDLGVDVKLALGVPVRKIWSQREWESTVDYFGLVMRGKAAFTKTLKVQASTVGLSIERDYMLTKIPYPLFTAWIGGIPVNLTLGFGVNVSAKGEADFKYAHTFTDEFNVGVGFEYTKEGGLKPINDASLKSYQKQPDFKSQHGKVEFKLSPYVKFDLNLAILLGAHLDVMPFLKGTYEGVVLNGIDDYSQFKLETGLNLRTGVYLQNPFKKDSQKELISYKSDDLALTPLYSNPKKFIDLDSLKVKFTSYGDEYTSDFKIYGRDEITTNLIVPNYGSEQCVEQDLWTDFPDSLYRQSYQGLGSNSFKGIAPQRAITGTVPLHKIGETWGTQARESDGVAPTKFRRPAPLGYKTILKTRILDGKGNKIMEQEKELPWEIQNFDATTSVGTIKYRDGGKYIYEVIPGDAGTMYVTHENGKTTMKAVSGGKTITSDIEKPIIWTLMTAGGMLENFDLLYWMKENSPTSIPFTFSHANILGYPCTGIRTSDGEIYYWQNLCLKVVAEEPFEVTSLTVLDEMTEK